MDLSGNLTEDEIYNMMKDLPDFLNFPFPKHWYEKYNIPLLKPKNPKEAMEDDHAFKCMVASHSLPPIIIREPIDGGRFPDVKIPEPIITLVETKEFDPKDTQLVGLLV